MLVSVIQSDNSLCPLTSISSECLQSGKSVDAIWSSANEAAGILVSNVTLT